MTQVLNRRRVVIGGAAAVLGTSPVLRAVAASPPRAPSAGAVALAFEPKSGTLLKVQGTLQASSDGGRHWQAVDVAPSLDKGRIASATVAAGGQGVVYLAGPGIGVLRSDPGMQRFTPRRAGLPGRDVHAVAAHADRPDTVYAYIAGRGIFRSEDGGARWRLMDAGPRGGIVQFVHSNLPGSMQSGWLFAAGPQGVQRGMDCFCGWRDAGGLGRSIQAVTYDPAQPANVHAATTTGIVSSGDGGQTWSAVASPAVPPVALVAGANGELFAASAAGDVWRRPAASAAWEPAGGA